LPAIKSSMLGSVVMSKLGVVGSPVVVTLACAMAEVFEINFWDLDLIANTFGT